VRLPTSSLNGRAVIAFAALVFGGCTGSIDDHAGTGGAPVAGGHTGGVSNGSTSGGGSIGFNPAAGSSTGGTSAGAAGQVGVPIESTDVDPSTAADGVPVASRVLRLSYPDYDRTLTALLQQTVSVSGNFPAEQPNLGPYEDLGARRVNEQLHNEFVRAAETLAAQLVSDSTAFGRVVGCTAAGAQCRDSFIDSFGQRAFRRPLSDTEKTRYRALFDRGPELVQSGDALKDGVRLVVQAMLQSPKFLYRVEVGEGTSDGQGVPLTDYEVATRLSYLFWGTLPDAELFQAAGSGQLSTAAGIAAQAKRLAASPTVVQRVLDFHERWLQVEDVRSVSKDATQFPQFTPALIAAMTEETRRFVEEVTLTQNGAVRALLTAPIGFVNDDLARVYGLSGSFGPELRRVEFDGSTERLGLLTQGTFLSSHSSASNRTSPILRGVFVLRRLACQDVQPPPPGAEMQEPAQPPAQPLRTTREYFTWKTSMTQCAGCHTRINPVGFAFEKFDSIGQFRTVEGDVAVDASGTLALPDSNLAFDGARQLVTELAGLPSVRACYAKNWLQYAYSRSETPLDLRTLALAARELARNDYGVRDLMVALTQSSAFSHLPVRE
jgi:hypothetical protein